MKPALLLLLLIFGAGCATTKKTAAATGKLNGTWIPIKQEFGGMPLPKASFENQRLTISDSNYTFIAESIDKGIVKYDDGKMDIYGKEGVNIGKHFTAIYKIEEGELSVCYNLNGNSYPETFDTKGKPMYFLSVSRKEKIK